MPPINRDKNTEYVILSITDGKNKMLDLTTANNKRNYKHKLINELKAQEDKRSPVYQEFKNSNINTIEIEALDAINGTYLHALNYMNKIATKYNYKTPKLINSTILDIQLELQAKQLERLSEPHTQEEQTPTTSGIVKRLSQPHTQEERLSEPHTQINNSEPERLSQPHTQEEPATTSGIVNNTPTTSGIVKKPKKVIQKIKLKPLTEEEVNEPTAELIKEAINTPINISTQDRITIDYEKDEELEQLEELEPLELKVILPNLKQKNTPTTSGIVKRLSEPHTQEEPPTTSGIVKLTKKQEQQKNKLIEANTQTINEYYTLKKQKESLEAKMNTLHLAILNNYTTLANTFNYVDGSISDFNFE